MAGQGEAKVEWAIDTFEDELSLEDQNLPEEERVLAYAKYVQERYFKGGDWVFTVTIGENKYQVDTEVFTVTKLGVQRHVRRKPMQL